MKGKNYFLKFALVIVIAGICVAMLLMRGLKAGIDIRGGHTLIYEVAGEGAARANLVQETIDTLRRRVDPNGLASLEWTPLSGDRFEVRMPAGDPESQARKNAYDLAMEQIERDNLQRSEIRRLEQVGEAQRAELIGQLAGSDEDLAGRLKALTAAYDAMVGQDAALGEAQTALADARRAGEAGKIDELTTRLDKVRIELSKARDAYGDALQAVYATNISVGRFEAILGSYVSDREGQVLKEAGKGDVADKRAQIYREQLAALRQAHPTRVAPIDRAVGLYEDWARTRHPLSDPADLRRLISKAGVLEFRIAPELPGEIRSPRSGRAWVLPLAEYRQYVDYPEGAELQEGTIVARIKRDPADLGKGNAPLQWFPIRSRPKDFGSSAIIGQWGGQLYILLSSRPGETMLKTGRAWQLTEARAQFQDMGRAIGFTFDNPGASLFSKLTGAHIEHLMAILLDNEAISSPNISNAIGKDGVITGSFSEQEQQEMVKLLNAGSLPGRVKFLSQSSFGPALGRVNRDMAVRAAYIGLGAVAAFMLVYYLLVGLVANVALVLNILLVLGVMSLMDAVFTLPGIAGIILTIGIAVDANVLVFEQLRREQRGREAIRLAVADTYKAIWPVIRDANITTLLTCLILAWVGTPELVGFAITLGLGVIFSVFCALFVTRWVIELLGENRVSRPFAMNRLIGEPKIRWTRKRRYFWVVSAVVIAIGIVSLVHQGSDIWGIEFSAGTSVTVRFEDDAMLAAPGAAEAALPNDGLVREMFEAQARQTGSEKLYSSVRVEEQIDPGKAEEFFREYDRNSDGKVTLAEWTEAGKDGEFFKAVLGRAGASDALTLKEAADALPPRTYQITTTEEDVELIRKVVNAAYGKSLKRQVGCEFELAGAVRDARGIRQAADGPVPVPELGPDVAAAPGGVTKLSENPAEGVTPKMMHPQYRDAVLDAAGGVMIVLRDVTPAITATDLQQRIRDMQSQADFAGPSSETEVLGLTTAGKGAFSVLAVLVSPPDELTARDVDAWAKFASYEKDLVTAALEREESMIASNFDAAIASEAVGRAIGAIVLSWLGIVLYLALSFRGWQWGFAAVLCLIHDVMIVVGLIAASSWLHQTFVGKALLIDSFKIDLAMVAAMLTVVGYSVNDTIVVFAYVRDRQHGRSWSPASVDYLSICNVLDDAINRTFSRTMVTSLTTLVVVVVMYIWGGPGIHAFTYALLVGVLFGTYSSIAIAAPLLMGLRRAVFGRAPKTT